MKLVRDPAEAHELRWFRIHDPDAWMNAERFDPGMMRFLHKLSHYLEAPAPVR